MDEIVPLCWLFREAERARAQGIVVCCVAYGWLCLLEQPTAWLSLALWALHEAHPRLQLSKLETVTLLSEMRAHYHTAVSQVRLYRGLSGWKVLLSLAILQLAPLCSIKIAGVLMILAALKKGGWWPELRALHGALTGGLVLECQRWWLGLGWLPCTLSSDPPAWSHWPSLHAVTGQLRGDFQPLRQEQITDDEGWQYGDNGWANWQSGKMPDSYTRRRFWQISL